MFGKSRLMTVALTLVVLAGLNRIGSTRQAINGETKILGIF